MLHSLSLLPNAGSLSASNNNALQEENDTLKCQMEAYKNEIDMVKSEGKNLVDLKDKQIQALQQALHGTQQVQVNCSAAERLKVM